MKFILVSPTGSYFVTIDYLDPRHPLVVTSKSRLDAKVFTLKLLGATLVTDPVLPVVGAWQPKSVGDEIAEEIIQYIDGQRRMANTLMGDNRHDAFCQDICKGIHNRFKG